MSELNLRQFHAAAILRIYDQMKEAKAGDLNVVQIDLRIKSAAVHFDRMLTNHEALVAAAKEEDLEVHSGWWDSTEATYIDLCATLNQRRKKLEGEPLPANTSHKVSPMELKIEPLCIPSFDGSAYKWLAFKDTFETLVHQRDLPVAYKLGKLRQAVKAESVPLVGGLYSGGYEELWTALKNRYDNPKQLAEIHVARFLNMKSQTEDTSRALLGVVDVVNESLRALAVMKLPVDKWDALTFPIVVSKLSTRTQREWCMNCSPTELSTLNELLAFLEKRAHSLSTEFCQVADHHEVLHSSSKQKNTLRLLKSNLATTDDGNCQHCRGSHKVMRGPVILALKPEQHFEALKRSNLCFNCFRSGHSSKLCSSGHCRQCGHRHHTIFRRHKSQQPISSNEVDSSVAKPDIISHPPSL
ncbi:uncharacterized protein LOC128869907 [Anastrepha ludens]|uniref:uncharacterized protein LOC128869907 n=1 Tax=Anastrepha ludens TaxID=28586 RepID=UPI0023AFDEEB|nr:uncharacterized protein LOC128869907 [Anastrepha ludens]